MVVFERRRRCTSKGKVVVRRVPCASDSKRQAAHSRQARNRLFAEPVHHQPSRCSIALEGNRRFLEPNEHGCKALDPGRSPARRATHDGLECRTLRRGSAAINEDLVLPLAIAHRAIRVKRDNHIQPAHILAIEAAVGDVEGHHGIAVATRWAGRCLRGNARAKHIATARFEIFTIQLPRHCGPPFVISARLCSPELRISRGSTFFTSYFGG